MFLNRPAAVRARFAMVLSALFSATAASLIAATFTVDTTSSLPDAFPGDGVCADSTGACSLRAAIGEANALPNAGEPDRIHFAIPGTGPHAIIAPTGFTVTDPVVIDGYTQPGASPNTDPLATNAALQIEMLGGTGLDEGLRLETDDSTVRGLAIYSFFANLVVRGEGNVVEGCFLGTDAGGLVAFGGSHGVIVDRSADNLVGGETPGARNLISGNNTSGVLIFQRGAVRNRVWGNLIGTDRTGLAPVPNGELTLHVEFRVGAVSLELVDIEPTPGDRLPSFNEVGGPRASQRNVISGNAAYGVHIAGSTGNLVENNWIGVAVDGSPLPNGLSGVTLEHSDNQVLDNTIAYNGEAGILVDGAFSAMPVRDRFSGNSLYLNGGLGVDLSRVNCPGSRQVCPDGVSDNDPLDLDGGPNLGQNFPVLLSAAPVSGGIEVQGELDSAPDADFEIELFVSDECDPSGHGEAQVFLGSMPVHTDATGRADFTVFVPVMAAPGEQVTATATDDAGNTSEISRCVQVNSAPVARCRNATAAADASCRAGANVDAGSYDPDGDAIRLEQVPAGHCGLGGTPVTLEVTDSHDARATCAAVVTVVDRTAPGVTCPADVEIPATSAEGALYAFSAAASDNCPGVSVECVPPGGSLFAIGTTDVTCDAVDGSGNGNGCTFHIRVKGAEEQLADLIALIGGLGFDPGRETSLLRKLQDAVAHLERGNEGAACRKLGDFDNEVEAQRDRDIPSATADLLRAESARIRAVIGCS